MDDKTNRWVLQNSFISIKETHEMRHWKKFFDCTARELTDAVAAVGNRADEIGAYIALHRPLMQSTLSDTLCVA